MNPQHHKAIPMHENKYSEFPRQPEGPTMVQYTTVNITTEPPRDHIIWSLISCFHSNLFCLGLAAIICSIKARDKKMVGDFEGARRHGSTAFGLNVAATVLFGALIIAIVVFWVQSDPYFNLAMIQFFANKWL